MRILFLAGALLCLGAVPAAAQERPDPAALQSAQRQAMDKIKRLDGAWRGTAWTLLPTGRHQVTHTERVGPFLGGTIKLIEGRAYNPDGSVGFNAFAVVSYNPATKGYSLQSYAQGYAGTFPLQVTDDGYVWQVPAGPGALIRYTATIKDGSWREVGDRIVGEAPPVRIFEMNLKRVGETSWPEAGAIPGK